MELLEGEHLSETAIQTLLRQGRQRQRSAANQRRRRRSPEQQQRIKEQLPQYVTIPADHEGAPLLLPNDQAVTEQAESFKELLPSQEPIVTALPHPRRLRHVLEKTIESASPTTIDHSKPIRTRPISNDHCS